ncbi:uncharacterized protein LOC135149349 [Daucus carota subsp. sativus]|uniref:uncharacterized protein LOC135149349 n=1 Tax=Daucus carota subsp. sativus TaxID=79200 RepID=UPI00308362CD
MVYDLTEEQKNWVRSTGLGPLLDFSLEMIPGNLAYNIFQIFDPNTVSLNLKNQIVYITEEDVYEVLGLPCGGQTITLGSYDYYRDRTQQWSSQFETIAESNHVTVAKLVQMIKKQGVSDNFKINFLIMMSNVLIGTPTYSYIDRQLLRLHGNFDECYKYNWAEFLIGYLVNATQTWNETASTFFRGSSIFLMMFYVDRVRHKGIKLVERRFPSFRGWTEDKLKERQAIDVYGGPFGLGYVMVPLREVPSQTPKQYAKASNQNKEAPMQNPDWDDWNAHQNDDVLWEEYENRHKQTTANGCETFNENNDPKDMPGAGEQEEPDIEVDKENGNPQASGAKDVVENLREMAQDLIETKLLFDTELKLALEKEPANIGLLDIQQLINDLFGQQKTSNIPRNSSPDTVLEDDFKLRREEVQQIDLIHFVQSAKSTVKTTTLFGEDDKKDEYPSFSLGIDEDINGNQAEQAAMIEEAVPVEENVPIPATEITPKPALREKSTRALKMGRYGKSPFLERVIDISSKITNQEFGIWRFMIQNKNPM